MSSINPGVSSPLNPQNKVGGVLPKGKLNDPMPTIKDDGPSTGAPGGLDSKGVVPGGTGGAAKPPAFVPHSDIHGDLNDLFDGKLPPVIGGPNCPLPPDFRPDQLFAKSKDSLLKTLKTQQGMVMSEIAKLQKIIAKPLNPAQAKEAKATLELCRVTEKALAGFQSLANNFKFPPGDGFSNNGQLAYAAKVFDKMNDYASKNLVSRNIGGITDLNAAQRAAQFNKELASFKKSLANLPPVDPRILPPNPGPFPEVQMPKPMPMN